MNKLISLSVVVFFIAIFANSVFAAPVAHWDFSETTGLVAADSVGSYDGTVDNSEGNMAWTVDSWLGDGALAMDNGGDVGTGGVVTITGDTGNVFKANSFTISAWIKPDYVRDRIVLAKTGSWSDIYYKGYELRMDGWGRKLMWYAGGSSGTFSDGVFLYGLEQNTWYNVIGMRDGNEVKLYVNGMLIGTKTITQPMNFAGTNPLTIGGLGGTNGKGWSFDGVIDDVRYYNHALSQTQIDQIYGGNVIMGHEPFTAEYLYAPELDTLSVQGYADLPANSAEVRFKDHTGDYSGTSTCVPVIQNYPLGQNATPDYTATFTDVAANWEKDTYNLEVAFFMDDSCANATSAIAYGGEFDALRILWIEDQLDQLNQTLQEYQNSTNENLTAIWEEFNATWDAINNNSAEIDWIEGQIADLWAAIDDLEDMTMIAFDYFSAEYGGPSLDLYGYAPGDAQSVEIWFYGSLSGEEYSECVPVDQAVNPEFSLEDLDLSDWEIDSYAIEGYFYDGPGCAGNNVNPIAYGNTFDDLLNDWLHENELGFELMDTQTFEVWNPQDSFTRKISWAFTAPEDGWYWFELDQKESNNGEDISKVFAGGTPYWINSHETKYFKNRNVLFPPEEGSYKVKLKAHNAFTSETIKSNAFRLIIDDLANPWPEYNVQTVSTTPNSGSYADGVYWTNQPIVEMQGDLGSDVDWGNNEQCNVWHYRLNQPGQSALYERWTIHDWNWLLLIAQPPIDPPQYCDGDVNLSEIEPTRMDEGSAPEYDIEVCAEPVAPAQVNCTPVTFGYDTTPPMIDEESLDPGTSGIVNGLWNFSADVTDDGVIARVWFTLTNKTNASQVCQLGDANNTVGDTWVVAYNTTGNCTPDGYYNFTVYAIDYAGNEAELTIDPLIDNTPPVVALADIIGYAPDDFVVMTTLTDNLAGVVNASAYVERYTCNDEPEECVQEPYLDEGCFSECMDEVNDSTSCTEDCTFLDEEICTPLEFCPNDWECEDKSYDDWDLDVPLEFMGGTIWDGVWGGAFSGDVGFYYEATISAVDGAGNPAVEVTTASYYGRPSYTVTIATGKTTYYDNEAVDASGMVTSSDSSLLPVDSLALGPGDVNTPIVLNEYMGDVGPLGTGQHTITATYTPNPLCEETFTANTDISVETAPKNGGGGGGGGGTWHPLEEKEVPEEPEEKQTNVEDEPVKTKDDSGEGEEGAGEEPKKEEAPTEPENLVTGAVTGKGFFANAWPWLLALLGLIIVLFGASRLFKKN